LATTVYDTEEIVLQNGVNVILKPLTIVAVMMAVTVGLIVVFKEDTEKKYTVVLEDNTTFKASKIALAQLSTSFLLLHQSDLFVFGFLKYKYIVHVDGNVAAFRLLKSMLTGSLILRVKSDYIIWADHLLEEGKHYVSVSSDLSDLNTVLDWCAQNDSKCKKIAEQGRKFAEKVLTKEFLQKYFVDLLNTIEKRTK
jgi:hypothetical protein